MRTRPGLRLAGIAALIALALPSVSEAFTVKVHIFLANAIREDLVRNWNETGVPRIRLMQPDGATARYVRISAQDAEAIRDNPEFFRGGAIGPDNTVMPGLTDPSHAWMFTPFSQCQKLLESSQNPSERAYALGCFLHGVSDNTAHHLVNFFTGETFTLTPTESARDGELQWSLLNVVRHIMTESRFEGAIAASVPDAFAPANMQHRIAVDLYRRTYLDPNDQGRGLWHWFSGDLVARKNDALAAAQLEGIDPTDTLELSIETIRERGLGRRLDRRVIDAYINFLKTGSPVDIVQPHSMAPADYVLMLPEIVEDTRRFLEVAKIQGEDDLRAIEAEWTAGSCGTILHPCLSIVLKRRLYQHLFAATEGGGPSRMAQAVARKNQELDGIVTGYIQTIERMSNLVTGTGIQHATPAQIQEALAPLSDAIGRVTDFPYDILFPQWAVTIIDNVKWIKGLMEGCFALIKAELKARVVDFIAKHLEEIKAALIAMEPQILRDIQAGIEAVKARIKEQIGEEVYRQVGLDFTPADGMLGYPTQSVWAMNAFNSVAGAMGNQEVVFMNRATSFHGGGPVSFDASYQLEYNQMAICEDLRQIFYPCGTSAGEMLQPDFHKCHALPQAQQLNPPVECHRFDATHFAESPTPEDCDLVSLDDLVSPNDGHVGSYTAAFPPSLVERPPVCIDPFGDLSAGGGAGGGDLEKSSAGLGGDGSSSFFGDAGCSAAPAREAPGAAGLALFALAALLVVRSRRRA